MDLEAAFKADISGWLEYENRRKSTNHKNLFSQQSLVVSDSLPEKLLKSLDSTLSYYNYSPEALEALHNTVFYNVIHSQDYTVDFKVVNFSEGVDHRILYYVCERFNLHKYTCYELWKMPAQDALNFIMQTFTFVSKPLRHFHHILIKLVQKNAQFKDIPYPHVIEFILNQFECDFGADLVSHHLPYILQIFYDCILDNDQFAKKNPNQAEFSRKSTIKLMYFVERIIDIILTKKKNTALTIDCYSLLKMIFDLSGKESPAFLLNGPTPSSIYIPVQTCQNSRIQQHDVKYDWHKLMQQQDANTTAHEQAFLVICWHLQSKCLVLNNMYQNDVNEKNGFDRLEEKIRQEIVKKDIAKCKIWCIFSIRNRASFWKSTLKVVIQFMDLWIKDIQDTKCADIFASFIAAENMMVILYNPILKHVQHYQKAKCQDDLILVKNLCQMLETCIEHVNDMNGLINFRDDILKLRLEADDIHLPTFESIDFWNIPFKRDLVRVCNQITTIDDETENNGQCSTPNDVVVKLIKLSIIWPYQVIQQLFLACVQNKNQFRAIIPILNMLGNLCVFRKSDSCSSLLMTVIQDTVTILLESNDLMSNQENITQFIKGCLTNQFTKTYPIILTPKSLLTDQPTKTLLDLASILNHFILPPLVAFTQQPAAVDIQLIQFNLHLLSSFCQYHLDLSPSGWDTVRATNIPMTESDLPTVLYCSSETVVHCLTFIMNLREQDEKYGVRLQDWEAALNYIDKFTLIINYGITTMPSQFRPLQQYFETTLTDLGWKSQLLWYPIVRQATLQVPIAFFRITGSLNGLFQAQNDGNTEQGDDKITGWHHLFKACVLSTELTDALFQQQVQWEYNLLLLWKHPIENGILQNGLRHALHPKFSNSVSTEYPKLLNHFLFKLFDSFDFYTILQDEQYYTDKSILPTLSQLSRNQGTRLYFVVLCIVQLLKPRTVTEGEGNENNDKLDLYFISCLIKVIQDITHWGSISKDGQAASYNILKEKLNQDTDINNANTHCYYYPLLNTEKLKSDRALTILTLYHLSLLTVDMNEAQSDIVQRLVMQIIEGIVDMESRQQYERMLEQQPKKRITNWKKKSKSGNPNCKQMRMRPILNEEETQLLKPVMLAQTNNSDDILHVLGLTVHHNDNENDYNNNDKRALYFVMPNKKK